jgi:hypothetical protein
LRFAALLVPVVLIAANAHQTGTSGEPASASSLPFSDGECLIYTVEWDPPWYLFFLPAMEAGEAVLRLEKESSFNDKKAFRILFTANSSGMLSKMAGIKIDDEFAFFSEPETLCSLKASRKIREGKRRRQIDVEYYREAHQLHIREIDESATPPKIKKDETKDNIPSCVQDPLSAVYLLRMSPLRIAYVQSFVIGYDDRIKEVESSVEKQENIETPAGKFFAWNIRTTALMGGLFKEGGQFRIWLSADERKIPVQFEVRVKLGKVMGKLKRYQAQISR